MADTKEKCPDSVPYLIYDEAMVSKDMTIRRLIWLLVLAVVLIFASNALWLHEWMQYDYVSDETITVDGANGTANYNYIGAGAEGRIANYGEGNGQADEKSD